jgi:hypothetical protein
VNVDLVANFAHLNRDARRRPTAAAGAGGGAAGGVAALAQPLSQRARA